MKRYPAYKDSGVEWLGMVPEGWSIRPLWSMFRRMKRTGHPEAELLSVYRDYGVVPKASRDDNFNNASEDLSQYQLVEAGDLAINKMKAWQGSVAISDFTGIVSPAYFIFSPNHSEHSRYLHYLMRSNEYTFAYKAISKGIRPNQWDLEPQEHSRMGVLLPPLPEQRAIADFLDRETAKIDAMVEEQRRLIALLAEKRQAVISHAVTKGLNPDAPLKPSGIDWLGDIPEGWDRVTLGRICLSVSDGPHFSPNYVDDGIPFLSARNVAVDRWQLDDVKYISEQDFLEFSKRVVPKWGDILYTKGGTTGVARVVDLEFDFQIWVHIAVLKLIPSVDPFFIAHTLNSAGCYEQSQLYTRGATNQDLGLTRMTKIWLALPPHEEQRQIREQLDEKTAQLDALTEAATSAIALLQERRAALISAAVTGKIDLRDEAALVQESA